MDTPPRGAYDAVSTRTCAPPGRTVRGPRHRATVHRRASHGRAPRNIYEYEEERRPVWDTPAPCGLG